MKRRVILESYDFGELCVNLAQTMPTFTNDHTQFLNSLDVFLNGYEKIIFDVTLFRYLEDAGELSSFYNSPFSRFWRLKELCQFLKNIAHFSNYFDFFVQAAYISR